MNSVASNYYSLKYQKSTTSSSIDIGIRKFEFVTKTQFLWIFFADSKSRAQELSNDVTFVILRHQNGIKQGGGSAYSGFQAPPAGIGLKLRQLWSIQNCV